MSRLFSILVSLFILFLLYLWINHLTKADNQAPLVETEELRKSSPKDIETKPVDKIKPPAEKEKPVEKNIKPATAQKKTEVKPRPKIETKPPPVTSGAHLVVAGNFLERANAEKHLKVIKDLGYVNAEILNFEISQYYTVIAGRYEDLAEARRIAKKLKDQHSIDTYVRNGN